MDHMEEQEMEAEALAAIFDKDFQIIESSSGGSNNKWSVTLRPIDCDDETERETLNHVGVKLIVVLSQDYPEVLPSLDVEIIKGLAQEQRKTLIDLATQEAESYIGMPTIYAVCEAVRTWLSENNIKGLDDQSMHAQMMRKQLELERQNKAKENKITFESQEVSVNMTEAELEDLEVRKKRAEGTPCTVENFNIWKTKFEKEMEEIALAEQINEELTLKDKTSANKKKVAISGKNKDETENRLTGYEFFTQKIGIVNLDALEKAAEEAENEDEDEDEEEIDVDELNVDEELFDDDEDLDDLDFDSDEDDFDDDDDDDSDDEVQI